MWHTSQLTFSPGVVNCVPAAADADATATRDGGFATADASATALVRGDGVARASES